MQMNLITPRRYSDRLRSGVWRVMVIAGLIAGISALYLAYEIWDHLRHGMCWTGGSF